MGERHFYRCLNCCHVFALDVPAQEHVGAWNGVVLYKYHKVPYCDCGGGKWAEEGRSSVEWMGKVQGSYVVKVEDRCPCDARCTHAMGPQCDCQCGGANHGTHALVKVVTNMQGIPTVVGKGLAERLAAVEALKAKIEQVKQVIDADPMVQAIRAKQWIKDYEAWKKANMLMQLPSKVWTLKTMAGRMKALDKVLAKEAVAA